MCGGLLGTQQRGFKILGKTAEGSSTPEGPVLCSPHQLCASISFLQQTCDFGHMFPIYRGRSKKAEELAQAYIVIQGKTLDQNSEQNNNIILHWNRAFQSATKFTI